MNRRTACLSVALVVLGCSLSETIEESKARIEVDRFADIRILRYEVPGFDELDLPTSFVPVIGIA